MSFILLEKPQNWQEDDAVESFVNSLQQIISEMEW